ncbi:MAG TPA: ATP-binding protein [Bryobacteraceae bacterium]|nr:ATP-binding protein [Bryobacteraceae bacterium]
MSEHLRFSTDILSRLGEELSPNADQGIMELVRNSYDADAVKCRVELIGTDKAGGVVRVTDDGLGMNRQALRDGWLVVGKSAKQTLRVTDRNRRVIGNKGLGRLAALRLGGTTNVTSWPKGESAQYSLGIDWAEFAAVKVVEDVSLRIEQAPRANDSPEQGTVVEIQQLHSKLTRAVVKRLARALVLMADPFDKSLGFQPTLVAPGQKDLESLVESSYFEEAQLHLVAELSEGGTASAKVLDWKGLTLFVAGLDDLRRKRKGRMSGPPYNSPPAKFDLWVYTLDVKTEAFSARTVTVAEVKEWLSEYGGVHIYQNGVRVHPYGDPGHDWLDLNLARVRNPELRPSTNTSIGRVSVTDTSEQLKHKTDRTGFIDNEQFEELRRFAEDALEWMASRRVQEREARRHSETEQASASVKSASSSVETALKAISPGHRRKVQAAFEKYQRARDKETKTLRDDLQLYRTLATVGTTSAVLAHEVKKPVQQIGTMAKMVERIGKARLGTEYVGSLEGPVSHIRRAAEAIQTFANVTTTMLQREKRRGGRIAVYPVIEGIGRLFGPFMREAKVNFRTELTADSPSVYGSVASLESILANLITNSLNAFNYENAPPVERQIVVRAEKDGRRLSLRVLDSGPGIDGLSPSEIWLPGYTTTPGGTGLGLTIVKDAVTELGGTVNVLPSGKLGGAEFTVELPMLEVSK